MATTGVATTGVSNGGTYYCGNEDTLTNTLSTQATVASWNGFPVMEDIPTPVTTSSFTVTNTYPTYSGGTWVASLDSNGNTILTGTGVTGYSGTVTATCPVNLVGITSLTINSGATVENSTIIGASGGSAKVINSGGTIRYSLIAGVMYNTSGSGAVSGANTYINTNYSPSQGSSNMDYFYNIGESGSITLSSTGETYDLYTYGGSVAIGISSFNSVVQSTTLNASNTVVSYATSAVIECFLPGSIIETARGFIAVENIQVNDQVITYRNGQQQIHPVIWIGHNHINVRTFLPEDEAGYPIRIVKNAIADNVPSKDLLITPEHSILINGQFIPARMLVNGSTISYDHTITEYTFYHIETEEHSIISANNVLTESYLDTGNRSYFISDNNVVSLLNKKKEWNKDSAAPLANHRNIVEPIFIELKERANQLGYTSTTPDLLTTDDCGLHLLTNTGEVLYPTHHSKEHFVFKLPEHVTQVRLVSRSSRPSQAIGPFINDRRNLGVLVGEVALLEKNTTHPITEHYTVDKLSGWEAKEQGPHRWTNGNALLTVRDQESQDVAMLVIKLLAAGPYIIQDQDTHQSVA